MAFNIFRLFELKSVRKIVSVKDFVYEVRKSTENAVSQKQTKK